MVCNAQAASDIKSDTACNHYCAAIGVLLTTWLSKYNVRIPPLQYQRGNSQTICCFCLAFVYHCLLIVYHLPVSAFVGSDTAEDTLGFKIVKMFHNAPAVHMQYLSNLCYR